MSRTKFAPWLAAVASVGACLGLAAVAHAQAGGIVPPGGPLPPGPGGMPQPGVGVGVGVGVGGVGVGVGANVGLPADVNAYRGVGSATQFTFAQQPVVYRPLDKWFYYPYYYFPHSYWPQMGPQWPENPGDCTLPPPAYMAYPPFREPNWRYDLWETKKYYKGFHFWLDQF